MTLGAGRSFLGKRVRGASYVHREAVPLLSSGARSAVAKAVELTPGADWNVVRLDGAAVGLLAYDDFDSRAFPRLLSSTSVDLASGKVSARSYAGARNPFILHRKEALVRPDDPRREAWGALTASLVALGLFAEPSRIGRERHWGKLLAGAGLGPNGEPA